MTVKELISELQEFDSESQIISVHKWDDETVVIEVQAREPNLIITDNPVWDYNDKIN